MSQHVLSSLGATAALQRGCPGLREAEAVRGSTSPDTPTAEPSLQEHPRAAAGRHRHRDRDGEIGGMNQELDPFPTHLCQRTLAPMQDPEIRSYKHAPRK